MYYLHTFKKTEEPKMTQTHKTTRFTSIVITLAILLSVFCIAGATNASAATERVSLYSSSVTFAKYGAETYEIFIKTNDNAQDQQVYVHYFYMSSLDWADAEAEYVTTLGDGSKIWKAYLTSFDCQYAIKYVADGVTYWDNNNGANYNGTETIVAAPVAVKRRSSLVYNLSNYQIDVVLQNYAYEKNVFVRYTTDGWNSYNDQALSYSETNADGTETWTGNIDISSIIANNYNYSDFEYAVCYQVNGTEYWANYFGNNYDINYSIHH